MNKKISFLGIKINSLTKTEIAGALLEFAKGDRPRTAFYLNAHCVNITCSDKEYQTILNKSDLVYAGGQGVVWAARFLGDPLPQRVNIMDFFDILAQELRERKITIYLLGGTTDVIKKAEQRLQEEGLKIIGSRDGFFDQTEEAEVIREINSLKPDILMVGMGVPKQEKWIYNHLSELDVNLCWAVGGVFKILSGNFKKTPKWISESGLEWLYLGLQDPSRLLNRYLFGNLLFVYHIFKYQLSQI